MKKYMPLEGLRWSRDSGSTLCDTPQNGRSRTGWGALLLCPTHSRAESYTLSYSLVGTNRGTITGSRSPKCPLVVDLEGHILTVPSLVIGNTLTLENEDGEVYTYYIIGSSFELPQELSGNYQITISDGNIMYHGIIEL